MPPPAPSDRPAGAVATTGRRTVVFLVKAAVTAGLVAIVLAVADIASVAEHLRRADLPLLGLAILLMFVICWLEAIQFAQIVRALGGRIGNGASFAIALAGRFFATASPAGIGSDMFRALSMRRVGMPSGEAARLALVTRLMSSVALAPIILAGLPVAFGHVGGVEPRTALVAVPVLMLSALAALVAGGRLERRFPGRWAGSLRALSDALARSAAKSRRSPAIWASALGQHLVRVLVFAVIARALGVEVAPDVLFAFVPVALLVAMAPVTLGSWGLRELSLVYALALAGVDADGALAASIGFGAAGLVFGAFCGVFWALAPARLFG